jgi:DNA-binding IclR family transcriptional regulator
VLQVESPADFGFHVRVGATFPVAPTATGALLAAFSSARAQDDLLSGLSDDDQAAFTARMRDAKTAGYIELPDARQPSIVDLAFPVLDFSGVARAALTVPYVSTSFSELDVGSVRERAAEAVARIASRLGTPLD